MISIKVSKTMINRIIWLNIWYHFWAWNLHALENGEPQVALLIASFACIEIIHDFCDLWNRCFNFNSFDAMCKYIAFKIWLIRAIVKY